MNINLDEKVLKQLIDTFAVEANKQLQNMTDGLLQLEKESDPDNLKEIFATIFRSAHNIKGSAGALGITDVAEIAHALESLLLEIKEHEVIPARTVIDLCFEASDKIKEAMQCFLTKQPLSFDINDLCARLKKKQVKIQGKDSKKKLAVSEKKPTQPLKTTAVKLNIEHPSLNIPLEKLDKITAFIEELQSIKIAQEDQLLKFKKVTEKMQLAAPNLQKAIKENKEDFINAIEIFLSDLANISRESNHLLSETKNSHNMLVHISNALEENVRLLKLVPADILLRTLSRVVRDLANTANKNVNLIIAGGEIEIDPFILESLHDPLIHLLRNAIDHGIELPAVRSKNGKPESGSITIKVSSKNNQIFITIADDGAGIDAEKIRTLLSEKNIMAATEATKLNQQEVLQFIFQQGFSTKEIITDVSGRGVGLDIVKTVVNNLKGMVTVATEKNQGSLFTLQLPTTLTREHGLIFKCNKQLFALPIFSIEKILDLQLKKIEQVQNTPCILLNKQPIPLFHLAQVLQCKQDKTNYSEKTPIIIVTIPPHRAAFIVDEIIGEREMVVKPLSAPLNKTKNVSGGILFGTGDIILMLNAYDLIKDIMVKSATSLTKVNIEQVKEKIETPKILLVDDSITTRTLEKNILENKNYQVVLATNGKEAWDILQNQTFALLITDVAMPIMDGFMLTEKVKQHEKLRHLPVIIVTSLGSEADKKRGIEVGADAYIVKQDFESEILLNMIEKFMQ